MNASESSVVWERWLPQSVTALGMILLRLQNV
jgi:hypothetical protein